MFRFKNPIKIDSLFALVLASPIYMENQCTKIFYLILVKTAYLYALSIAYFRK